MIFVIATQKEITYSASQINKYEEKMQIFINRLWSYRNSSQDYIIKENNKYIEIRLMPHTENDQDIILEPNESLLIKTNIILNDVDLNFQKIESSYYLHMQNVACTDFWSKTYLHSQIEHESYYASGYFQGYIYGQVLYVTLINQGSKQATIKNEMYVATIFFEQTKPDNIQVSYYGPAYINDIPDTTQYKVKSSNDKDATAKIITGNSADCVPKFKYVPITKENTKTTKTYEELYEELQRISARTDYIHTVINIITILTVIQFIYKAFMFFYKYNNTTTTTTTAITMII